MAKNQESRLTTLLDLITTLLETLRPEESLAEFAQREGISVKVLERFFASLKTAFFLDQEQEELDYLTHPFEFLTRLREVLKLEEEELPAAIVPDSISLQAWIETLEDAVAARAEIYQQVRQRLLALGLSVDQLYQTWLRFCQQQKKEAGRQVSWQSVVLGLANPKRLSPSQAPPLQALVAQAKVEAVFSQISTKTKPPSGLEALGIEPQKLPELLVQNNLLLPFVTALNRLPHHQLTPEGITNLALPLLAFGRQREGLTRQILKTLYALVTEIAPPPALLKVVPAEPEACLNWAGEQIGKTAKAVLLKRKEKSLAEEEIPLTPITAAAKVIILGLTHPAVVSDSAIQQELKRLENPKQALVWLQDPENSTAQFLLALGISQLPPKEITLLQAAWQKASLDLTPDNKEAQPLINYLSLLWGKHGVATKVQTNVFYRIYWFVQPAYRIIFVLPGARSLWQKVGNWLWQTGISRVSTWLLKKGAGKLATKLGAMLGAGTISGGVGAVLLAIWEVAKTLLGKLTSWLAKITKAFGIRLGLSQKLKKLLGPIGSLAGNFFQLAVVGPAGFLALLTMGLAVSSWFLIGSLLLATFLPLGLTHFALNNVGSAFGVPSRKELIEKIAPLRFAELRGDLSVLAPPASLLDLVNQLAQKTGVPPALMLAILRTESGGVFSWSEAEWKFFNQPGWWQQATQEQRLRGYAYDTCAATGLCSGTTVMGVGQFEEKTWERYRQVVAKALGIPPTVVDRRIPLHTITAMAEKLRHDNPTGVWDQEAVYQVAKSYCGACNSPACPQYCKTVWTFYQNYQQYQQGEG